jgi:hypothetical protein
MNSYAIGIVAGTSVASINGGLVRLNGNGGSLISDSYATGSVADTGSAGVDGGLVGENAGGIVNSYATGAVKGSSNEGGLVGINGGTISDAYSTGSVSGKGFVGGLIGDDASPSGSITDAYWDTTTSSITNLDQGAGNIKDDPGIVGLTSKQLRSGLPQGFDSSVWTEKHRINSGFPYLLALPPGTKMSPAPLPAGLSSLQFSLSGAASSPDNDVWHRLAKFHQN